MENVSGKSKTEYNMTFCILSGIAIIMVVAGHLGYNILTVGDLFPYYSFHVPLFMFISGYFYKESEENHPLLYLKKKVKRLLVPYFIWNLIYGVIAWLMRAYGFTMGEAISFRTLFIAPFMHGYQFIYNYAAWFVPVLFLIEMSNLVMRIVAGKGLNRLLGRFFISRDGRRDGRQEKDREECSGGNLEWLYLAGSLAVGMIVVYLAIGGHVWGDYKAPGRFLFLYPCYQMGQFYKRKLEKHDTLGSLPYFAIVLAVQVILQTCCNGLAFSSVWCTGFANGPLIPYVTIISGIAFWLRIARIITPVLETSGTVRWLGKNTYTVMMHHVMIFMLIKMILSAIAASTRFCADFDTEQMLSNVDYVYLVNGAEHFKMVYLSAGICVPLLLKYIVVRLKRK